MEEEEAIMILLEVTFLVTLKEVDRLDDVFLREALLAGINPEGLRKDHQIEVTQFHLNNPVEETEVP